MLGLEPKTYGLKGCCQRQVKSLTNQPLTESDHSKTATIAAKIISESPGLEELILAWPGIPAPVQQAILKIIR